MTQGKNSSMIQLIEVFPSWSQEDLSNVLNEAGGDVYVAITRISEGHVSQWSDSSKKAALTAPTFESRPARNDRSNRREGQNNNRNENRNDNSRNQRPNNGQRDRPQQTSNRASVKSAVATPKPSTAKPVAVQEELSWGSSSDAATVERASASMVSANVIDRRPVSVAAVSAPKTSFAEAAASALAAKAAKKSVVEVPIVVAGPDVLIAEEVITVPEVEAVVEENVVAKRNTEISKSVSALQEFEEEEDIVSMPTIATPSLTMEQPAVVLPVRTNLRANLSVRFGYEAGEEIVALPEKKSAEETQSTKTPISVSALESTFAMMSATVVKNPEPILSQPATEASAWEQPPPRNVGYAAEVSSTTGNSATSGYGNFSRGRQNGGWDYEPTAPSTGASSVAQGSFGPAPGFSGPTSPVAPQRFVSRAASQYEHPVAPYNASTGAPTGNVANSSRFSPYEESDAAGNNVSQYYTSRASPQASSGYSYRGGNSFNPSRYSGPPNRPYYQQHHPPAPPSTQQQSAATGHYASYNPHQNYLNNYHHGYGQYPQHADQYSHQHQQQQPQQQQAQQPQQPYYQPYQPPNQYLSNPNIHHHAHHGQNQHHNA
jgi:hypothetical protein